MFGFYELERNLIVARLSDGRKRKQMQADVEIKRIRKQNGKLGVGQLTQNGQAKYIGSKSTLHKCIEKGRLTAKLKQSLRTAIKSRERGLYGWRVLGKEFARILGVPVGSHEKARRMAKEFMQYFG